MPAERHSPSGESNRPPAPELVEGAFALETSYAPALHEGLNLADMAHVLDLTTRGVIPEPAAASLLAALLEIDAAPAGGFPYDPADGEPYNSRERVLVERVGDIAGWLHVGRPRREATRIALRIRLRRDVAALVRYAKAEAALRSSASSFVHGTIRPPGALV